MFHERCRHEPLLSQEGTRATRTAMKILPYRRFTIETRLEPSEVEARLKDAVQPPPWFHRRSKPERPLIGRVDGITFDVMRSVPGRNSFRPFVRGTIEPAERGARITGTLQLHALVIVFLGAFLLGAFLFVSVGALPLVIFFWVVALAVFIPEAGKVLQELARIVDATHAELR